MTAEETLNPNQYADRFASDFYKIFGLNPSDDIALTAADILEKRDAVISWNENNNKTLRTAPIEAVQTLYEALKTKIASGSIGSFDIGFAGNGDEEPIQDRHPLLRVVDFIAHGKRSVQAYSYKGIDWLDVQYNSARMKEFGDEYDYNSRKPLITHLFLDVENHGYYADDYPPIEDALSQAVQYEKDIKNNAIDPAQLVQNPEILRDRFESVVGEYDDYGMGGVQVDVPALMKWETIADTALHALSPAKLRLVYNHFMKQEGYDPVRQVIIRELESVCMNNPELQKHLEYGASLSETLCDIRVAHLVADYGRFPANLDEAFEKAIVSGSLNFDDGPAGMK
jgi:hypothetical protein